MAEKINSRYVRNLFILKLALCGYVTTKITDFMEYPLPKSRHRCSCIPVTHNRLLHIVFRKTKTDMLNCNVLPLELLFPR